MEIKRSEVHVGVWGKWWETIRDARKTGKRYYVLGGKDRNVVYTTAGDNKVCQFSEVIDDAVERGIKRAMDELGIFPPLPDEPSSDTPTDRARDAALRDCDRGGLGEESQRDDPHSHDLEQDYGY